MNIIKIFEREKPPIILPSGRLSIVSGVAILLTICGIDALTNHSLSGQLNPLRVNILAMVLESLWCGVATYAVLCWIGTPRSLVIGQETTHHRVKTTLLVSSILVTISAITFYFSSVFNLKENPALAVLRAAHGFDLFILFVLLTIIGPISEELFFRGFLYNAIATKLGPVLAAIASSFIFAAVHGNIQMLIPIFCASLLLTYQYQRLGSVFPVAIAHGVLNVSTVLLVIVTKVPN
jgi:membrane protease YdiL (CAAX protease family)